MRNREILWLVLLCVASLFYETSAAVLTEWNFNSTSADSDAITGSLAASRGDGTIEAIGGVTVSFGTVGGGNTSDPASTDDSQLRLRTLPRIDANNKSAGIELTVNTIGFETLVLSWDQFNSRTASRFWRVQYSTDGTTWTDHELVANTTASKWVSFRTVLDPILAGQASAKIRLVQEFESTAVGDGADGYVAVDPTATYSTAGSWWMDMISLSDGGVEPTNALPAVSVITNLVFMQGTVVDAVPFIVSDIESSPFSLQIAAHLSNPEIISSLFLNGGGSNRWLSFVAQNLGETEVTIQVSDEPGHYTEMTFTIAVVSEPVQPLPDFFLLWNFNSAENDGDSATGDLAPTTGPGQFNVIGTTNFNFGTVAQGRSSDASADNSMLRLSSFPRQGENDKTAGIEIHASTAGKKGISMYFDQYNSGTASRFWLIQYATNGLDFVDFSSVSNLVASTWHRYSTVSFRDIPGVDNNPEFAVRFVSKFGSDIEYLAVTESSNYSPAGTLWLDMIGFSGESIPQEPGEDPNDPTDPSDPPDPPDPITPPELTLMKTPELRLSWPAVARDFILEFKSDWSAEWVQVGEAAEELEGKMVIPVEPDQPARFYRLRKPTEP